MVVVWGNVACLPQLFVWHQGAVGPAPGHYGAI